jgi:PPOX class probable F420-dependent enzyme
MSDDTRAEFLQQPHVGVLATLQKNGRPYTVPVWWLFDDSDIWLTGTVNRVWCKHLMTRPNCSLCIEALSPVAGHVGIDGIAEVRLQHEFDIWPMSRRLADKYVGLGDPGNTAAVDAFFANMRTEPRVLFKLQPQHWRAIDMRQYRGKKSDREYQQNNQ